MIAYHLQASEGLVIQCPNLMLTTKNLVWEERKLLSVFQVACPLPEIKVINGQVQAFSGGVKNMRKLEIHLVNGEKKEFVVSEPGQNDAAQMTEILKWLKMLSKTITGVEGNYEEVEKAIAAPTSLDVLTAVGKGAAMGKTVGSFSSAVIGGGIVGNLVGTSIGGLTGGLIGGAAGLAKKAKKPLTANQENSNSSLQKARITNDPHKCAFCGAPLPGRQGQSVRCPYCDSDQ